MPPSPTGPIHVGTARAALYNWLFARQNGGKYLLRIEDTDKERSKKEYEEEILNAFEWLGLEWDNEGDVWRQSERGEIYKAKIQKLIKKGSAYLAEDQTQPSQENYGVAKQVVRFRNPGGKIKFQDLIRGEVEIEVGDLNDFIIAKNIDEPLYHLAVVVDDLELGVTHVIRGEDHISNTPRQILILEALGGERPVYAHLPLLLAPDKSKLSKRKHGESVSLKFYKEKGYSKEALINFLALLGWNPGDDREIFTLDGLIKEFDISKVQKKGAIFNIEKLDWMNREWILRESFESQVENFRAQVANTKFKDNEKFNHREFVEKFLKIILDRIHRWGEVSEILESGEFDYLFEAPALDPSKIAWKDTGAEETKENLKKVSEILDSEKNVMKLAEEKGKGNVLWPLRYALSGKEKSPDPITLLDILGISESKNRIEKAIEALK